MVLSAVADAADGGEGSFRLEAHRKTADEDLEYQLLKQQIELGFSEHKRDFDTTLHPYWQVGNNLLVSDDDFVLLGTYLVHST